MSTNTFSHSPSSLSENDPSSSSTRLQNQPHVPDTSALLHAYEEVVVTADHAREDTSSLPHHPTSTTIHHHRDEIINLTTAHSLVRHGDSVAESSQQRGTKSMAQEALNTLTSSSASVITSPLSLVSISAAETFGQTETLLSISQGDLADMPTSTHVLDVGPPPSGRVPRNSRDASESTGEDLELNPAGPPCISGKGDRKTQSDMMDLIENHVKDPYATNLNLKITNLAKALVQFYEKNARPPEKKPHLPDPYLPKQEDLEERIEAVLDAKEAMSANAKCRKIFKIIDCFYGSWAWTVKVKKQMTQNDSGIGLDTSQPSQVYSEPNVIAKEGTHPEKRLRDPSVLTIPPQKRSRIASSETQESFQSLVSSQDLSQDLSELPESQGRLNSKVVCPIEECGTKLKNLRGILKHLEEVHFPGKIFICPLQKADGTPCHAMIIRRDGFLGPTGHFQSHHQISCETKQEQVKLRDQLIKITINDIYHDVCPYCVDQQPLESRKQCIEHMGKHASGNYVTHPYNHRCSKDDHDWRSSPCIPQEYRKEIDTKKKPRQSRQDHNLDHINYPKDDDDEDDDIPPGPPGSGNSYEDPAQGGNGNGGKCSSQPSGANIFYPHGNYGSHNCHLSTEPTSTQFRLAQLPGIKAIKKCFKSIRELGRGGFGTVDEVVCKGTNQTYARKIIPFNPTVTLSAEVEILKQLRHRHIVNLAAFCTTSDQLWMLMSPVAERNLASYLGGDSIGGTNWPDRELLCKWEGCLASAVGYLHQTGLIHGDIKPQNILVSSDLEVYLADFGSARANCFEQSHGKRTKPSLALTPKYCAPETSYYKPTGRSWDIGTAADIFSLGCVWAEMETISTGLSLPAFEAFRSAGSTYTSFQANLPRTYCWIDFLWVLQESYLQNSRRWPHAPQTLQIVKDMLNFDPVLRPNADKLSMIFHCPCNAPMGTSMFCHSYLGRERQFAPSVREAFGCHQLEGRRGVGKKQINVTVQVKGVPSTQWKLPAGGFWFNDQIDTLFNGCPNTQSGLSWQAARATSAAPLFGSQINTDQSVQFLHRTASEFLLNGSHAEFDAIDGQDHRSQFDLFLGKSYLLKTRGRNVDRPTDSKDVVRECLQKCSTPRSLGFHQNLPSHSVYGLLSLTDHSPEISPSKDKVNALLSLTDYFREISPPSSVEDTFKFWESALCLIDAGAELCEKRAFLGWHQDIKPDNVLILNSETKSPYEWNFKLSDLGISHFKAKEEDSKEDDRKIYDAPECYRPDPFETAKSESIARRKVAIYSFGCILAECVAWKVGGSEAIYRTDFTMPPFESELDSTSYDSYLMGKAQKSKEDLLESLLNVPESVTKSIAETIIAPMFDPPDQQFSWKRLRDKATTVLNDMWNDYKKSVAKAADPILSLVRPRDKSTFVSSTRASDGSRPTDGCSDQTEIFDPHPENDVNGLHYKDVDIDPNISTVAPGSSYTLERYLRDKSDYRVLLASNLASAGRDASKELHKIFLGSVVDRLERFDREWVRA